MTDGLSPKISGQTSTPGAVPVVGRTKYASAVPSGVVIITSDSVTSTALSTLGSIMTMPAPRAAPNCRRVTNPRASKS
jgi:hypothetical protein